MNDHRMPLLPLSIPLLLQPLGVVVDRIADDKDCARPRFETRGGGEQSIGDGVVFERGFKVRW